MQRKLKQTLNNIWENPELEEAKQSSSSRAVETSKANGSLWAIDLGLNNAGALGDATLQDVKALANRIHNLRGRTARLANVVDMIH